jgi:hypothetical protein
MRQSASPERFRVAAPSPRPWRHCSGRDDRAIDLGNRRRLLAARLRRLAQRDVLSEWKSADRQIANAAVKNSVTEYAQEKIMKFLQQDKAKTSAT